MRGLQQPKEAGGMQRVEPGAGGGGAVPGGEAARWFHSMCGGSADLRVSSEQAERRRAVRGQRRWGGLFCSCGW